MLRLLGAGRTTRKRGPLLGLLLGLLACGDDAGTGGAGGVGGEAQAGGGGQPAGAGGEGGQGGQALPPSPGLRAEYWSSYLDLTLQRVEPTLDVVWGAGGPSDAVGVDRFSARWTGTLTPPETGAYTLITDSDDGVRVWLDGRLIIDDWAGHFVTRNTAEVTLTGNEPVELRVDYFEIDIDASIRLSWSKDTIPEQIIPSERLTSAPAPSAQPSPRPPYTNPVLPFDCPDPGVLQVEAGYYAVCTGGSFPVRSSRSLLFWADTGAVVLPAGKPSWAANGFRNWAPEIHRVGGHYVAYFTSVNGADVLSIGAASADAPTGPFSVTGGPLVQHPDGVIDATYFEDGSGKWLIYKIDGNAHGRPTPILARQLSDDGLSFAAGSTATTLLVNDTGSWEGGVIEAPWIVVRQGVYYMFYSGNVYDHRYRTGVARAPSLLGPWEKHGPPILQNNERWVGPGHGSVVSAGDTDYFVYHAWSNAGNGTQLEAAGRQILVDRIDWVDGWPAIHDGSPSRTPQPWPGSP